MNSPRITNKDYWAIKESKTYIYIKYMSNSGNGKFIVKLEYFQRYYKQFVKRFKNCWIIKQVYMQYEEGVIYFTRNTNFKEGWLI